MQQHSLRELSDRTSLPVEDGRHSNCSFSCIILVGLAGVYALGKNATGIGQMRELMRRPDLLKTNSLMDLSF